MRDRLVDALDAMAIILKASGNRRLLPIYERLERELAALEDSEAVMRRAMKRTKELGRR
jgi:hypothetical protein